MFTLYESVSDGLHNDVQTIRTVYSLVGRFLYIHTAANQINDRYRQSLNELFSYVLLPLGTSKSKISHLFYTQAVSKLIFHNLELKLTYIVYASVIDTWNENTSSISEP